MYDAPKAHVTPLSIGRYQVTDCLGEGGMGVVYLARDPSLERFVAIKLMREGFDTAEMRERFVREARAVASLRHPCIVTVFEYGDHQGQPFIVMEYVTGKTLAALIRAGTPISLARRLQLTRDLCLGLEHAHRAGMIHRDIKPANIMVDGEGTLKILDFGIAKLGHAGNTQISALVGTPRYMSPEQISGKPVTRRSDIFSVGLVVYELLSSRAPYAGENQYAVMHAIVHDDPAPLARHVPDLDPRIIRIVEKALEKDPDRRYQELSQMRREVERICNELALADPHPSTLHLPRQDPHAQLEELGRRRAQQIAANLENVERAFEIGDYEAALATCEDVLIIDPHEPRALEGLERARAALAERQALANLKAARQHFAHDELTLAEQALQAAFQLTPSLREGLDLQEELGTARQKREGRERALQMALDRARIRLDEGAFESAVNAADEALRHDPEDPTAKRLKAEALVALEASLRERELDRRAQVAADQAMHLAARDLYEPALDLLRNPDVATHPLARQARERVENARAAFDRLRAEALASRPARHAETTLFQTVVLEPAVVEHDSPAVEATPIAPEIPPAVPSVSSVPSASPARSAEYEMPPLTALAPLLGISHSDGHLPGPVRPRKSQPARRPVWFVDQDADRGGGREWFHDQLFVSSKQGHDSIGFGVSFVTHGAAIAIVAIALVLRPNAPPPPPPVPLTMITLTPPSPPPPTPQVQQQKTVPQKPTPHPAQSPVTPQVVGPITAVEPPKLTDAAPIESPGQLPTSEPIPTGPVTTGPGNVTGPILVGNQLGDLLGEVPVDDFDQEPVPINEVQPKVPVGASGVVRVQVTVLTSGKVSRAKVLDPTPFAAAIQDAASQCTFRPAKRRGKSVPVTWIIAYALETKK